MKNTAFILLLILFGCGLGALNEGAKKPVFAPPPAPTCGPPTYVCAFTGTNIVQPGVPPFSSTTPVNTVIQESILSNAKISKLTDKKTGGGLCHNNNFWLATPSGGSYDVITNTTSTLLVISCGGGNRYIVGFNPLTLHTFPASPQPFLTGTSCSGAIAFSRVNQFVAYCREDTALYTITFALSKDNQCGVGNCPDVMKVIPTWKQIFDFSTCPQSQAAIPTSGTLLGVGFKDSAITDGLSWSGDQGTAFLLFYYVPGTGVCSTFNTQGNKTNPVWYGPNPNTLSNTATWFIHDATTTGPWVEIAQADCVGSGCGNAGDGPPTWQANTNNLQILSSIPQHMSGHHDYSLSYFINNNSPQIYKHLLSNPTAAPTQIGNIPCNLGTSVCSDFHLSADISNDVNPVLGTTAIALTPTWNEPYRNEVIGVSMDGSGTMFRWMPTWSSGTSGNTNFWGQYAIAGVSQTRCVVFFTSDMLGKLGPVTNGTQNRTDIFAVGICGQ